MTEDLERRLREHNSGKSKFTAAYRPWEVIYTEEIGDDLEKARQREKYFKSAAGRRYLKKILEA